MPAYQDMPLMHTVIATPEWLSGQMPADWLTQEELRESEVLPSPRRRQDWRAGRIAVKKMLYEEFGILPLTCRIGKDGSAPIILGTEAPAINISLSHSHGAGAAAWAHTETEGTVGIDIQAIRPIHAGLSKRILTEAERRQISILFEGSDEAASVLLFWTLKEAAIKARRRAWGRGLREIAAALEGPYADRNGKATITVAGEPSITADYVTDGAWHLARALQRPNGL